MLSLRRQTARQRSILISIGCNSGMPFLRESPETCQYNFDLLARLERSRSIRLVKRLDGGTIRQSTHWCKIGETDPHQSSPIANLACGKIATVSAPVWDAAEWTDELLGW